MIFKVMTANIRFENDQDINNLWSDRKIIFQEIFNKYYPDIICTQEGREPQLRELESVLTNHQLVNDHRDWIAERMYPCLYNKSYMVKESGDIWLSNTPLEAGTKSFGSMFPRLSTWAIINIQSRDYLIANLHLDHTTDEVRNKQVEVFINEVKNVNANSLPIIICGDFNACPHSDAYNIILNSDLNLKDPFILHGKDEESTYHKFKGAFEKGCRIDWILCSDELSVKNIVIIKDSKNGKYPSDHFPLCCEFELNS